MRLVAPFHTRMSAEDLAYLQTSARLLERIGNSRTRGLGEVEVTIKTAPITASPARCRPAGWLQVG